MKKFILLMSCILAMAIPVHAQEKTFDQFKYKLGQFESEGKYTAVNSHGHMGLYQIHPRTLRIIGVKTTRKEFLKDPALQDSALVLLLKQNFVSLKTVINKWDGKYYRGIKITKSGILAGAHLVGPGGVLAWFYPTKYDFKTVDGNGVTVGFYLKKFSGYALEGVI